MQRLKRFAAIGLGLAMALLPVAGCAAPAVDATASGSGKFGLNVAGAPEITYLYTPTLGYSSLAIAEAKGYFKELGINVKLVTKESGNSGDTYQLVGTGSVVGGNASWGAGLFNAAHAGVNLSVVASPSQIPKTGKNSSPFVVGTKSGIKTVADLKGKRVGVPSLAAFGAYSVSKVLATGGLTLDDVELVTVSPAETGPALSNGSIVASYTNEPTATQLEKAGIATQLLPVDYHAGAVQGAVIFNGDYVKKYPDAVVAFIAAYLRGFADLHANNNTGWNTPENLAILAKYTDLPEDVIKESGKYDVNPDNEPDFTNVRDQETFYRSIGKLEYEGNVDLDALYLKDFAARGRAIFKQWV